MDTTLAACAPAAGQRRDDRAADIGEIGIGERRAFPAKQRAGEAAEGLQFFPKGEAELAAVGANHEHGDVVFGEILGITRLDFSQQRFDHLVGRDVAQYPGDPKQAVFTEHFAVGVARFDEGIGIAQQAVAGLELDIELFVHSGVKQT